VAGDKTNWPLSLLFHSQKKSVPELNDQPSYKAVAFDHDNEVSDYIKGWECTERLNKFRCFKNSDRFSLYGRWNCDCSLADFLMPVAM
jgi:hypothetical protein